MNIPVFFMSLEGDLFKKNGFNSKSFFRYGNNIDHL